MHKEHGNIRAQRKRRRNNIDDSLYIEDEVRMIDGNYTHYPYYEQCSNDGVLE